MNAAAAAARQVHAADPAGSAWVTANAGSGKTRVLTDRVARLLLAGTPPQRILCLTYTKAAAAEMQNRLFGRLGGWAMLPDTDLRAELAALGEGEGLPADRLAAARRLFAGAIEAPGGLRIQTIHGFCAALLRRFPLEAGVSPGFAEMDDRTGALVRESIVEAMAAGEAAGVVATLAAHMRGEDLATLAAEVAAARDAFDPPQDEAAIRALLGADPAATPDALAETILGPDGRALVAALVPLLAEASPGDARLAPRLADLPGGPAALPVLEGAFLYGAGTKNPFGARTAAFPTKETRKRLGARLTPLLAPLADLMARVEAGRPRRLALETAIRTAALHRFAAAFLPRYEAAKAARGWLDFDDLILRARALLADPAVAQWVLWRLDGGIDHILVDEAQDTSPGQWEVVERLAQEIVAGEGARGPGRTLFVVGDRKQSIYSFQGADLAAFDATGARFERQLSGGLGLRRVELEYSFRSSPAILCAVDATFDHDAGRGIGGPMRHIAFHGMMPGRVDLWPVVPRADKPDPAAWFDPVDLPRPTDPAVVLAETIADTIAGWIAAGVQVQHKGKVRPLRPGDILILVQRRSALFAEIIRACKARGLPMAGADRLRLGAELAVRDLAALLAFLDLPSDDLALAAALRSPLFGWSEAALYALAHGRTGSLWQALRDGGARWAATLTVLTDLRAQADYLRPHALIDRILTRHDGRRRLIARLGPEAEDGIDQLLAQALDYERLAVPSLTGFNVWLETGDVEARRQVDAASNRIRVMTVHGAKGLEAPVVILPDTVGRPVQDRGAILRLPGGPPLWRPPTDDALPAAAAARAAIREARAAERDRLLYVAMTRAESWLIVAGVEGAANAGEGWHGRVRAGLEAAGAVAAAFPTGTGLRLATGDWPPDAPGAGPPPAPAPPAADPGPPPPPAAAPAPRSPSDLGGAKALPGEGDETAAALARGTALHRLLELLPAVPKAERAALAARIAPDSPGLPAEAEAVLGDPALAPLFAPGALAEATVAATLDGVPWLGTLDRLVIAPDRVLAVDFKSNRVVPERPEEVPEGLLRQMGAYAAILAAVYPGRRIETAILWTAAARLMPLPDPLVREAFLRAASA